MGSNPTLSAIFPTHNTFTPGGELRHKTIDEKVKTLDDLYQLGKADQRNRWMLILEVTIVFLFIIDLVVLFMGLKK